MSDINESLQNRYHFDSAVMRHQERNVYMVRKKSPDPQVAIQELEEGRKMEGRRKMCIIQVSLIL